MTIATHVLKKCAICGTENYYSEILSTSAFGSPDLDTRPPELERYTIYAWVQRCPNCGYCAPDISKAHPEAASVIKTKVYKEQLSKISLPELANNFICESIIEEAVGDFASAAWSLIHAAWTCDDENEINLAKEYRSKAIDMIFRAVENGQKISNQQGAEIVLLVDLMRRAGRFSEAKHLVETKRSEISDNILLKILDFQKKLIARFDDSIYKINEALEEGK